MTGAVADAGPVRLEVVGAQLASRFAAADVGPVVPEPGMIDAPWAVDPVRGGEVEPVEQKDLGVNDWEIGRAHV